MNNGKRKSQKFRYDRILLVNSAYPGSTERAALRAGLGYIAEILDQEGFEYDVFDMELDYGKHSLKRKIKAFEPSLIAISMMTFRYKSHYDLAKKIKLLSDAPIVAGGPHIAAMGSRVLEECNEINYGVQTEGEEVIIELCRGDELSQIKGLIYRKCKEVVLNEPRPLIQDLDSLPFPRYKKFDLGRYISRTIPIVSSRGCPYKCIFCDIQSSMGKSVRVRSPENIVDELEYWCSQGQKRFGFADDNFTFSMERTFDICDEIEKRNFKNLNLLCINGLRADRVNKDLLRRMKDVGFSALAFGVESGSERILKNIKKGETLSTIKRTIEEAVDLGYDVSLHFVIGTPGETMNDIEKSFELAQKYPVHNVSFNNLIPYPSTELFKQIKEEKRFIIAPEHYLNDISTSSNIPVFATPELSVAQRQLALIKGAKIKRVVRRNYYSYLFRRQGVKGKIKAYFLFVFDGTQRFIRNLKVGRVLMRQIKAILLKIGIVSVGYSKGRGR